MDVESVGEPGFRVGVEKLRGVDFDRDGLGIPMVSNAADLDQGMRLALVVEGVRHGPGEAAGGGQIREGTRRGEFRPIEVGSDSEVRLRCDDGDVERRCGGFELRFAEMVVVVGQQVSAQDHQPAVGITSQNAKAAQGLAVTSEDAVTGEEEISAAEGGQESGSKSFGSDQGDGQKGEAVPLVEADARWQKGLEPGGGQGIGQHQGVAKSRLDGEGMTLEPVEHNALLSIDYSFC